MAVSVDIRSYLRLCLALLLFAVAVSPACLLMSPAMAMASEMPSEGCGAPSAPATSSLDCPHKTVGEDRGALVKDVTDLYVAELASSVEPLAAQETHTGGLFAAAPMRPVAHLTPLRL